MFSFPERLSANLIVPVYSKRTHHENYISTATLTNKENTLAFSSVPDVSRTVVCALGCDQRAAMLPSKQRQADELSWTFLAFRTWTTFDNTQAIFDVRQLCRLEEFLGMRDDWIAPVAEENSALTHKTT